MQEDSSYKPTDDISYLIEDLSNSALKSLFSPIITVSFLNSLFVLEYRSYNVFWTFIWQ